MSVRKSNGDIGECNRDRPREVRETGFRREGHDQGSM